MVTLRMAIFFVWLHSSVDLSDIVGMGFSWDHGIKSICAVGK